jgi:hypothetical protein
VVKEGKVAIVWSTDKSDVSFGADRLVVELCLILSGHLMDHILEVVANGGCIKLGRIMTFVI